MPSVDSRQMSLHWVSEKNSNLALKMQSENGVEGLEDFALLLKNAFL